MTGGIQLDSGLFLLLRSLPDRLFQNLNFVLLSPEPAKKALNPDEMTCQILTFRAANKKVTIPDLSLTFSSRWQKSGGDEDFLLSPEIKNYTAEFHLRVLASQRDLSPFFRGRGETRARRAASFPTNSALHWEIRIASCTSAFMQRNPPRLNFYRKPPENLIFATAFFYPVPPHRIRFKIGFFTFAYVEN